MLEGVYSQKQKRCGCCNGYTLIFNSLYRLSMTVILMAESTLMLNKIHYVYFFGCHNVPKKNEENVFGLLAS
jgi:hypothetical protein